MSVNYEIWGSPETWVDGTDAEQKANVKFAEASKDTYQEQYVTGGIPLNDIDKSPAFWGIGKDSIWCKPQYLSPYMKDGETEVAVDPVFNEISSMPCIIMGYAGTGSQYIRYKNRYKPMITEAPPNTAGYGGKIILDFAYKNIVLVPWVRCKATGWSSSSPSSYSLHDYITNARYNSEPEIVGIAFQSFMGDGTVDRSSSSIGICSPVDFKAYAVYHKSTYFWAQQGCSQLLATTNIGTTGRCLIGETYTTTSTTINNLIGDSVTALAYKYSVAPTSSTDIKAYYFDPDNPIWKINKTTVRSGNTVWYEYPYIEVTAENITSVREYILSQIAYIGLPFVYNPDDADQGQIGDIGVYLPVFDENGITTGEYEEGTNALRLPNADWVSGRESGYDPNVQPEGDLDNSTGRNLNFWASSRYYLMRQSDLDKFLSVVNGLYTGGETAEEKAEELRKMQVDFKGSNPADYIVGLYGLPFQWKGGYTLFQPVMLGPVRVLNNDPASDTAVELLNPDFNVEMLFGEISIPALGNFMDYEPYTTLLLYVPFCGTVQLSCAEYIGQTVRVVGTLDKHTGDFTVRIMRNGLTVTNTLTGNLYVRVPITAQQMGDYQNNIHQLQMAGFNKMLGALTGTVTGGVSIASGTIAAGGEGGGGGMGFSPTAPISMAANLASLPVAMWDADFRITHCQPSIFYSSGASSANQAKFYTKAKLFIKRPVMLDSYRTAEQKILYAHTVGNACVINDTIGGDSQSPRSGLVKVSSVDLSGLHTATNNYPPTLAEQNLIKQSLMNGVYV